MSFHIAVVGGGISGLVAARAIMEKDWPERPVLALFEAEGRLGGAIATERRDDFLLEGGPDSFLTGNPAMLNLVKSLKLDGEIISTNPACRRSYAARDGKLYPLPDGFDLIDPLRQEELLHSAPPTGFNVSLRGGMSAVVMKLFVRLPMGVPRLKCPVTAIERTDAGKWRLSLGTGDSFEADAVCLALPAAKAAALLESLLPAAAAKLRAIRHESVATVNFAYERADVAHALDGFGFVVPPTEHASITAGSFSSVKFEGRAPEGKVLLRAFVGGVFGKEAFARGDEALIAAAEADLARYLGITGKPLFSALRRYPDAMVQYGLGHKTLVAGIRREMEAAPGFHLTGPAFLGNGLPDCVTDAEAQAEAMYSFCMRTLPAL